jgi:hypothetical protein
VNNHQASTGLAILTAICCTPALIGAVIAWLVRGRVDRHGWQSFIPGSIRDALADISLREPKQKPIQPVQQKEIVDETKT